MERARHVADGVLHRRHPLGAAEVAVDSPSWFAWPNDPATHSFSFEGSAGQRHVRVPRRPTHPVAAGGWTIDPQIVTTLLRRRRGYDPLNRLASRERELVTLMAAGTSSAGRGDEARVRRIRQCGALTVPGLLQTGRSPRLPKSPSVASA